jgi:hypothetical protein
MGGNRAQLALLALGVLVGGGNPQI